MKIVIVGGTSSLGLALKKHLCVKNQVLTAGRKNCDIYIDLNKDHEEFTLPEGIDVLIHTASSFGVNTYSEIEETLKINTLGTLKILRAASKSNIKHFIFISSIFSLLKSSSLFYSAYSISKNFAEEILNYYVSISSKKMILTILRPSQIYGSENTFRKHQPFFYKIIDDVEKSKDVVIYGSNDPKRNYIHINDLTSIIERVIKFKPVGTFNCSYPKDISYSQVVKAAKKAFKSESEIKFISSKEDIKDNTFENDTSLYELINFYPKISILEGIILLYNHKKIYNNV